MPTLSMKWKTSTVVAIAAAFILLAGGSGRTMASPMAMKCNISDLKGRMSANFKKSFCSQLSTRLGIDELPDRDLKAWAKVHPAGILLFLNVRIVDKLKAEYSVTSGKASTFDFNGRPDLGPMIVEVADANIEQSLSDHLYNDIKRYLSSKP